MIFISYFLLSDSGNESGNHVSRKHQGGYPPVARSLPVTVPVFHPFNRRTMQDENDEQVI